MTSLKSFSPIWRENFSKVRYFHLRHETHPGHHLIRTIYAIHELSWGMHVRIDVKERT